MTKQTHLTNEAVKRLRAYHGMTLKEFAERVGTSFVTIHRIEQGKMKLSESMEARIIEAFALNINKMRSVTIHYRKNIEGYRGGGADE